MNTEWDCIVVGAGAAGLSAALVLGRARRRTLVVDAGRQSNLVAHGIGGLLGQDGRPPAAFYEDARAEVAAYPSVELRTGEVVSGERREGGFVLELADGSREASGRVLLATGADYRYPDLAGLPERFGHSAFHCPFCHGWEVRDKTVGVLGSTAGAERALLLRLWSEDVTLYTDGPSKLEPGEAERLEASGIAVEERLLGGLRGPGNTLEAVVFADGGERSCDALFVPVTMHQRSTLAEQLGARVAAPNLMAADAVEVDNMLQTRTPGLSAAGDLVMQMPSVAKAVAEGSKAAMLLVRELAFDQRPSRSSSAA
jgi:thioredoxin reductase